MEFITDYRLERYILDTRWETLPDAVKRRARVCALDLMTALILGSHGRQFQAGLDVAERYYQPGDIPVLRCTRGFGLLGAVEALGHAANSFDIDDGHNLAKGHPGASFVGGVLAAALENGSTLKEYTTTLVVCYDVAVRIALAMQSHYQYFHSTGAYGAVATAAGMGRLMGLTKEQLNNALSIADFHAPLTPVMRAVEYPSMNKDGVPFGSIIGAMAVTETLAGSSGKTHLLELAEERHWLDDLGDNYEILNLYFKPYTCCRWAHQPIQASIDLMREKGITARDIESVTVHTYQAAARLSKIVPHETDEAQYNIAYPVAAALVYGDVGYPQVCEQALGDQRVLDMMQRLAFTVDPAVEAQFPAKRLAWVEITCKDGRRCQSPTCAAPGEREDQVDEAWIRKKFTRITKPFLKPDEQERLMELFLEEPLELPIRTVVEEVNRCLTPIGTEY